MGVVYIVNFMKKRGAKQAKENESVMLWLNGQDAKDILCPKGYYPLTENEEIVKCSHIIADLVSSMSIMLMENRENGDTRIKNELSRKIDIFPCSYMTRKNFIYKIVYDLVIQGNSIAYPLYENGLLKEIQLWDMDSIHIQEEKESYVLWYKGKKFYPDEVLHFVFNPDRKQPFIGLGFTKAVQETIRNLIQANTTKTGFLQSKWKPSMIISIDADNEELTDPQKRRDILDSYTKTTEIGEPWLIPAGELRTQVVTPLTLKDLAIQESITLDKKAIAAAFHMPSFMLGVGEFHKEEYNNFIATTIMSVAMAVQQELTKKLLYNPHWYFKFNPKSLLQYDLSEKVEFVKTMVSGGMLTRNEGRNEFDFAPVDDKGMNEFIVLENYVPVDRVGDQKKLKDEID